MSKYLIVALATAGSLLAGAATAGDDTSKQKPATSSSKASKETKSTKQATTPTAGQSSTTVSTMPSDVVAMAPVPDTKENRAKYGKPLSSLGRQTAARGN